MIKKLDFQKLENNFKKFEIKEKTQDTGMANVIRYVWNQYPTRLVDFDSFSYDDVISAMDAMLEIPVSDEDNEHEVRDIAFVQNNPWYHNMIVENAVANLHRTKNKIYENDDDFI